jgi:hypothetical protein
MRTFSMRTLSILLFVFCPFFANAQCYERITDQTGYILKPNQLATIEAAACKLMNSIPQPQRDSFGIFEIGFYQHNPVTAGGVPEFFEMAKAEALSKKPFYLLIAKQADASGLCTRFWIDLKLPLGGEFSCLNKISPQIRSDLTYKYQFIANTVHDTHLKEVDKYDLAVSAVFDSLTQKVLDIIDCCDPQAKGATQACNACVATPNEIAQFFRDKGYIAIPIKILTPVSARPDSVGNKESVVGVDICTSITSIELDGTVCNNFAQVVSNIVGEWPGGPAQAVITDNGCMCAGGLEQSYDLKHQLVGLKLKIHIWRNPGISNPPNEDLAFVQVVFPDSLGVLPFKGFTPIGSGITQSQNANFDINKVQQGIQNIYKKNGFSLQSVSALAPNELLPLDLYNLFDYDNFPGPGSSYVNWTDSRSEKRSYISYGRTIGSWTDKSQVTKNYWLAMIFAHEFLHQMNSQYISFITVHSNYKTLEIKSKFDEWGSYNSEGDLTPLNTNGHILTRKNLIFPGNGLDYSFVKTLVGYALTAEVSPYSYQHWPEANLPQTSVWETIAPSTKRILSFGLLANKVSLKFTFNSCETKFTLQVLARRLDEMKFQDYE